MITILWLISYQHAYGDGKEDIRARMLEFARLAEDYNNKTQFDSAIACYDSACRLAIAIEDPENMIHYTCKKGTVLWKIDSTRLSLSMLIKARNDAYEMDNDTIRALADNHLGLALSRSGMADSAEVLFSLALENYEKNDNKSGIYSVLSNLAILHKNWGNYDKALEYALRSYWLVKDSDDPVKLVSGLVNLGNAYEKLKMFDTAAACYHHSYIISMENGLPELAYKSLNNQAITYFRKDELETSRDLFLQVIDHYEQAGYNMELAMTYSNISLVYRYLEDFDNAIYYAGKSVDLADKMGYIHQKIRALNNLGTCYSANKEFQKAERNYKKSLKLALEANLNEDISNAYGNLAELNYKTNAFKDAYNYLMLHDSVKMIIYSEASAEAIARNQTIYKVRYLEDQNNIAALKQAHLRSQRNTAYIIGVLVILTLFWIAVYYIMKLRKNRIISEQRIKQLEDEKKILAAQSVILGQEEERKRIAQELHDGIGVLLSTASIQFSSIGKEEVDTAQAKMFLKAQQLLDKAGKEVRRISHAMIPGVLLKFGLKEAVEDLLEEISEAGNMEVKLDFQCPEERLPENTEIMLYRIIQELVNNTIKHAEATTITYSMKRSTEEFEISFSDNGKGFEEDKLPHNKSMGLHGLRSRVDFLGGTIDIQSAPGKGARFNIKIPLSI
ncbi:MAG: sensor histidine kinase [bacterium]